MGQMRPGSVPANSAAQDTSSLLTGRGTYVGDVRLPGQVYMGVVRSQHAHGHLREVDTAAALCVPGVLDAFSASDLEEYRDVIPHNQPEEALAAFLQPVLAERRVRYVGEPLAVVVGETPHAVEDGMDGVVVEVDPLQAILSVEAALDAGAVPLHEGQQGNVAKRFVCEKGDVDAALRSADVVIEQEFSTGRHSAVPLETRGLVAHWEEDGELLTVYGVTKIPHRNRTLLARFLGLPLERIRFVEVNAGGGFGVRGEFYPEDFLVPLASIRQKRPVKWIEDRSEHLIASNHSREARWRVRMGVTRSGRVLGIEAELEVDIGAYIRTNGTLVMRRAAQRLPGPYDIKAYRCRARSVLTNKTPVGTLRSPGTYEATFVRERLVDIAADHLGLDPANLRLENFIRAEQMPYETGLESGGGHRLVHDSGDYAEPLHLVIEQCRYHQFRGQCSGSDQTQYKRGIGLATYTETAGAGPPETARASLDRSGSVRIMTGAPSLGQMHANAFALIASAELAIRSSQVVVEPLDSSQLETGGGTFASRGMTVAGSAVYIAVRTLRDRILSSASASTGIRIDRLALEEGHVVDHTGAPVMSLAEIAKSSGVGEKDFTLKVTYKPQHEPVSYGATCVIVGIDVETGIVRIERAVTAVDVGRIVSLVDLIGQIQGAFVQGIGGALLEGFAFDEDGQPLVTTLMDYLLPVATDVPTIEVIPLENYPSPLTPTGAKGGGEIGIQGAGAALANAIADALGGQTAGVCNALPITPEALVTAIRQSRRR